MSAKKKAVKAPMLPKAPAIPGIIAFTATVFRSLWSDKALFLRLLALATLVAFLLVGAAQQDQFAIPNEVLKEYKETAGNAGIDSVTQVGILFSAAAFGGLNVALTEAQGIYLFALYLLVWLVTIWLLRHRMAGSNVQLRDGLYSAGTPVVSTLLLLFLMILQLLPASLGIIVFSGAISIGLLVGAVVTSIFASLTLLVVALSLYWVTSTFFALIIATIPGTYPMKALRSARDIVAGQRIRLVVRLAWLLFIQGILWAAVLLPLIVLDTWFAQSWLPFTVFGIQLLTGFSVIYGSAYVYLLYRKMIDEPAK